MSETFSAARTSIKRLRTALHNADDDALHRFAFWCIGLSLMAFAIVAQFGWIGAAFCLGVLFNAASKAIVTDP